MQLKIDLTKVEDRGPITPGIYNVKVVNVEVTDTQAGNQMITLQLEITDKGDFKGRKLRDRLVNTAKAMWRMHAALTSLFGPQPKETINLSTDELMGATGKVHIVNEVWALEDGGDGRTRPKVSAWISEDAEDLLDDADVSF